MILPKHDFGKDLMKKVWDDLHGDKKVPGGKPISRKRKRNIEKAVKNSSEVKGND